MSNKAIVKYFYEVVASQDINRRSSVHTFRKIVYKEAVKRKDISE
ncbi:hypothetical protein HMPREF1987_01022 [Peptostreptococcaceae bacterium oral taxon 113 str. W5053]|nr:hypothetical protein HMPREF1987_01022 [Peptostreptococcaceae bacterium oral taxon 113 str. W5053]